MLTLMRARRMKLSNLNLNLVDDHDPEQPANLLRFNLHVLSRETTGKPKLLSKAKGSVDHGSTSRGGSHGPHRTATVRFVSW